ALDTEVARIVIRHADTDLVDLPPRPRRSRQRRSLGREPPGGREHAAPKARQKPTQQGSLCPSRSYAAR
ncbi:hypothetical protein, partial [Nocardia gipuzkoensis]